MIKISVVGAINWDINLFVERFPKIGEEVPVEKITRIPVGKAANTAVAAARILGPRQVALIGCLGKDSIAENQIEILEKEGIIVSGIKRSDSTESGQAYIIIDKEGRNVINTLFGANSEILPTDIYKREIKDLLVESSIIAVVDPSLKAIKNIAFLASEYGKTFFWDTGVR